MLVGVHSKHSISTAQRIGARCESGEHYELLGGGWELSHAADALFPCGAHRRLWLRVYQWLP